MRLLRLHLLLLIVVSYYYWICFRGPVCFLPTVGVDKPARIAFLMDAGSRRLSRETMLNHLQEISQGFPVLCPFYPSYLLCVCVCVDIPFVTWTLPARWRGQIYSRSGVTGYSTTTVVGATDAPIIVRYTPAPLDCGLLSRVEFGSIQYDSINSSLRFSIVVEFYDTSIVDISYHVIPYHNTIPQVPQGALRAEP